MDFSKHEPNFCGTFYVFRPYFAPKVYIWGGGFWDFCDENRVFSDETLDLGLALERRGRVLTFFGDLGLAIGFMAWEKGFSDWLGRAAHAGFLH